MSFYSQWGFRDVPFQVSPLPATEIGSRLLVGRDDVMARLTTRLATGPKVVTIEGINGVGKTSLVNVATYRAYEQHIANGAGPLLLPCSRAFQLSPNGNLDEFATTVWYEVARTIANHTSRLGETAPAKRVLLDRWLNSPVLGNIGASIGISISGYGGSISGSKGESANTSDGFRRTGLPELVKDWLKEVFVESGTGGVVCILDNLELLQESEEARRVIEVLRDSLLMVPGLRWVLCGSLGVVHGVASSPRLDGVMYDPIDLAGITDASAEDVLRSRVSGFGLANPPYLPLGTTEFAELYHIMRGNLRAALNHADEYCLSVAEKGLRPESTLEQSACFHDWLDAQTRRYASAQQVGPRAWGVFDRAVSVGGGFSPSDFAEFGFESLQALRPHVRDLEEAGLLVSVREDGDRRRKTVRVTPKGWLVSRGRPVA